MNKAANSWLQFDFTNRSVWLTRHTRKSDGNGGSHLLKWAVAGSGDGASWDPSDCRKTQDWNDNSIAKTCPRSAALFGTHFHRYIRLAPTGKNSNGSNNLTLAAVAFFGRIAGDSRLPLPSNPSIGSSMTASCLNHGIRRKNSSAADRAAK
jgi:hypothetical protein